MTFFCSHFRGKSPRLGAAIIIVQPEQRRADFLSILVDAGTALAPGAVSRIDPCGKYLIFFSHKGREVLADKFGAPFVSAVGDVCTTTAFAREDLAAMAAQQVKQMFHSTQFQVLNS